MRFFRNIVISIIFFTIVFCTCIPSYVNAISLSNIFDGGDVFTQSASEQEIFNETNQQNAIDNIYYILLAVGIILAFAIGIVLGIKFITTGVEGQAKIKEKLIPYIIGCIVVFGGFGIWRFVINISSNVLNSDTKVETQYDTQDPNAGSSHESTSGGSHGGGGQTR